MVQFQLVQKFQIIALCLCSNGCCCPWLNAYLKKDNAVSIIPDAGMLLTRTASETSIFCICKLPLPFIKLGA